MIFENSARAYYYALERRRRIPEVEEYLLNSKAVFWCASYAVEIFKDKWPECEKILLNSNDAWLCYLYAKKVMKLRWKKAESIILEDKEIDFCMLYAKDVIKDRWLEAEEIIATNINLTWDYCREFKISISSFQEQLIQHNPFIIKKIEKLVPELAKKYHHLLINQNVGIL